MSIKRFLFILIDGLGDVSTKDNADKDDDDNNGERFQSFTPLSQAHIPHLNHMSGIVGLVDPVFPGLSCGSDTAHLSLLGYKPNSYYRGRGAFESLGAGMEMEPGSIAFKVEQTESFICGESHFAKHWINRDIYISIAVPGIFVQNLLIFNIIMIFRISLCVVSSFIVLCLSYWARDLSELPSYPDVVVRVRYSTEHRCGVVLYSKQNELSDEITGTDPLNDNLPLLQCRPITSSSPAASAVHTCGVVEEMSRVFRNILQNHPINTERSQQGLSVANAIIFRGAGKRIKVDSFASRWKCDGYYVAPTSIVAGLCSSLEMKPISCATATGDYHTNLLDKAKAAVKMLIEENTTRDQHYQWNSSSSSSPSSSLSSSCLDRFVFVHIKAVDDAGHDGNWQLKINWLERIDEMCGSVIQLIKESLSSFIQLSSLILVVTGDHSTSVASTDHSSEPVPILITTMEQIMSCSNNNNNNDAKTSPFLYNTDVTLSLNNRSDFADLAVLNSLLCCDRHEDENANRLVRNNVIHNNFDEIHCSRGILGRFPGEELIKFLTRIFKI